MKRVCLFSILLATFGAAPAFAQENPQQQPATLDSAGLDSSAQILQKSAAKTVFVQPQSPPSSNAAESSWAVRDFIALAVFALSLLAFLFGYYQYRRKIALEKEKITAQEQVKFSFKKQVGIEEKYRLLKETEAKKLAELTAQERYDQQKLQKQSQTAEEHYRDSLREELGHISLLGSPDVRSVSLNLVDCFVNLDVSERWHSEDQQLLHEGRNAMERERDYPPNKAIQRALKTYKHRLLLIIGDPGSGKTTLMKYYALQCLQYEHTALGFDQPRLPIFLPLRDVDPGKSLAANLDEREKNRPHPLSETEVNTWLAERDTLILLDGLDEVSQIEDRIEVCRWIERQCRDIGKAFFVVTSRWTGYRKADGIELEVKHLRADVRDFTPEQQKEFLQKWFRAVFLSDDLPDDGPDPSWQASRLALAQNKARGIIDYLSRKENKSLRELAAIPMLLQIMAIIWKEHEYMPRSRVNLYHVALNYLLEHRDRHRKLYPLISAEHARSVLGPAALWMQEELHAEEVEKEKLHDKLQPGLNEMDEQPNAKAFCENLRDRAGVIADYGRDEYIFRHKTFREYFAGMQLAEVYHEDGRMETLIEHFGDDWWEEPLRFLVSKPNGKIFDGLMGALFRSEISHDLNNKQQDLLRLLVQEAGQRKIDALVSCLNDSKTTEMQKRYILECLWIISTGGALTAICEFLSGDRYYDIAETFNKLIDDRFNPKLKKRVHEFIIDIVSKDKTPLKRLAYQILLEVLVVSDSDSIFRERDAVNIYRFNFFNPIEYNAEYILIKGGMLAINKGDDLEGHKMVPDLYFAKYPVTNRQYRRFIRYLRGEESELLERVPLAQFGETVLSLDDIEPDHRKYLGDDAKGWADKLVSTYDDERKFNGDDQPVVGVSWYAAQTYCLWLSILTQKTATASATATVLVYRLPHETEWEWAAAGDRETENGALRKYPWGETEPNDKLANFGRNVGTTTPVGRYPDGATPEGLQDMAGNVLEWQENWANDSTKFRALRGGTWDFRSHKIHCSARIERRPNYKSSFCGFRVVVSQTNYFENKTSNEGVTVRLTSAKGVIIGKRAEIRFRVYNHDNLVANNVKIELMESAEFNIDGPNLKFIKEIAPFKSLEIVYYIHARTSKEIPLNFKINEVVQSSAIRISPYHDNPYTYGPPILTQESFFGREKEMKDILQAITKQNKQDIMLIGERRSGKTSLLYQLYNQISPPFVPVYVVLNDCPKETSGVIKKVVSECIVSLRNHVQELPNFKLEGKSFTEDFRPVFRFLQNFYPQMAIVLLIDEGDFLLDIDGFVQNSLRAALQSMEFGYKLRMVIAGTGALATHFTSKASPFFNHFRFVSLRSLSRPETERLIKKPASDFDYKYDQETVNKIIHACGGHPYYCQRICYEIFNLAAKKKEKIIEKVIFDQVYEQLVKSPIDDAFTGFKKYFWESASTAERALMLEVALLDKPKANELANFGRLLDWEILRLNPKTGFIDFSASLFKDWVIKLQSGAVDEYLR